MAVEWERKWTILAGVGLLAVATVASWAGWLGYQEMMIDEAKVVPQRSYGGEFYPLEGQPLQGMTASIDRNRGLGWFHQGPTALNSWPGVWGSMADGGRVYVSGEGVTYVPNNTCRVGGFGTGIKVDCSPKLVRIVYEADGKAQVTVRHSLWSAAAKITRRTSLAVQRIGLAWRKLEIQLKHPGNVPGWYYR